MELNKLIELSAINARDKLFDMCREIKSLEEAFRVSFLKWLYVDYCERRNKLTTTIEYDIAKSSETCGLCVWDDILLEIHNLEGEEHWCKFCPIGRDSKKDYCFKEFRLWVRGELPAIKVYERIAKEYERLLKEGKITPFEL